MVISTRFGNVGLELGVTSQPQRRPSALALCLK
jgi:hypothetical protein